MGILNITPDSFSDGGLYFKSDAALRQAEQLLQEGADIIDVGGESSRPGAQSISIEEELARVVLLIERLRDQTDVCISIDTTKAAVMDAAVKAGATFINDITALKGEGALRTAAALQVPICLMHMQGTPEKMQQAPFYQQDIILEINNFFKERIEQCMAVGIQREHIILDPGFGFGKLVHHNLELIKYFEQFKCHELPLMLGVSRKSTLGLILNKPVPKERLIGGITLAVVAALKGVSIIRTHDVEETNQAFLILETVLNHVISP